MSGGLRVSSVRWNGVPVSMRDRAWPERVGCATEPSARAQALRALLLLIMWHVVAVGVVCGCGAGSGGRRAPPP